MSRIPPGSVLFLAAFVVTAGCDRTTPSSPSSTEAPLAARRVEVTIAADGVTLGGILHRPDTTEPRPAVVVLHGWQPAGTNGAALVEPRAQRFAQDGYVALALSMRGWPPSSGADDCGLGQPDDVVKAVEWLRVQPGVLADRLGLVGFSQGGQVALLAAGRDPRIRAVVAYFPVTDVALWKTTTARTDIPGYITSICEPGGADRRSPLHDPQPAVAPVLLVHGDADTRVPTEQSRLLHAARQARGLSSTLLLVPGAQHGFTASEEALARPEVDRFLSDRLR